MNAENLKEGDELEARPMEYFKKRGLLGLLVDFVDESRYGGRFCPLLVRSQAIKAES